MGGEHSPLRDGAGVARHHSFLLVFLAVLLAYMPGYVVLIYLVQLAANVGVGRATDALAVSAVGVISVVGRNVDGVATDWFGRGHLAAACAVVNEATTTGLMVVGGPTKILALSVVFGGIGSLVSPVLAELFGTDDLYALFALTSRSFAIAGSVAPYLSGAGYEVFGTFQPEFVTAGVVALVAACIFTGTATVVTGEN